MKRVPPYLTFRIFTNFLEGLRNSGIPTRIDRSVMPSKSGSTQSQLRSSLFYLGLMSENGVPTPDLKILVEAEGRKVEEAWQTILRNAYPDLFALNVESTTNEQLQIALSRNGLKGDETIRKAINFFCLAAKRAGIKLSSHIKPYAGRQLVRKTKVVESEQRDFVSLQPGFLPDPQNGSSENEILLEKFPKFDPSWPADYVTNWVEAYSQLRKLFKDENTTGEPRSER